MVLSARNGEEFDTHIDWTSEKEQKEQTVQVPWSAWYNERKFELTFPDSWRLSVATMKGGPDIGDHGIRAALANPIGAPAAHRAMTREDFVKKVGEEIVERYFVINHNAYENPDFLGHSSRGVPMFINRDFMACEVRIALGMIMPRGNIFGGGSKLVLPGASGYATILANHRYIHDGFREHLDEVAGGVRQTEKRYDYRRHLSQPGGAWPAFRFLARARPWAARRASRPGGPCSSHRASTSMTYGRNSMTPSSFAKPGRRYLRRWAKSTAMTVTQPFFLVALPNIAALQSEL